MKRNIRKNENIFQAVNRLKKTGKYKHDSREIAHHFNRSHEELMFDIMFLVRRADETNSGDTLDWFIPQFSHEGINPEIEYFHISEDGYDALGFVAVSRYVNNKIKEGN